MDSFDLTLAVALGVDDFSLDEIVELFVALVQFTCQALPFVVQPMMPVVMNINYEAAHSSMQLLVSWGWCWFCWHHPP